MDEKTHNWHLDPRTGLALLLLSNIFTFTQDSIWLECGWIAVLGMLMLCCRYYTGAFKWLLGFALIIFLQISILPVAPKAVATAFSIFVNYTRRLYPCLMVGILMVKKISLRELIVGLRKLHFPQKLIVALSVTLRYIPAIKEEVHYIYDATKLRNIKGVGKVEAIVVPLIVSATGTAEELSAAAVTRGIENPTKKTSVIKLRLSFVDYLFIFLATAFTIVAFLAK